VLVAGQQTARGHDVDRYPEQLHELVLNMHEIEEAAVFVKLDQEVNVARIGVVAAGQRTEEIHPFTSMCEYDTTNLITFCVNQFAFRAHKVRVPRGCSGSGGGGGILKT
jgi:hypothetical protein